MSILAKHLPFVNEQVVFHEKMVEKFSHGKLKSEFREKLHIETATKLKSLASDLIIGDQELDTPRQQKNSIGGSLQLSLALDEIEGLPPELVNELSISNADKTEFSIVNLIAESGGILSMDRILIGLYKKTGEVFKRNTMTSKLYRMSQKGLVYSVPNKKGYYSIEELTNEDVTRIFGAT